ncbi:unnamed protein product [Adineta steineri]|uniref:Uncharacterized protein n=3 Tax=Adineta steineri TaxID=433720 RepID=A0A814VE89_9BILA|nr:unnamed protein product [Adineta steineri]CAF3512576.1 unnamed protein product [Adineta steineri]
MASSNTRRSSSSYSDSGISVSTAGTTVNQRYACYWTNQCQGHHELDQCQDRRNQLRGKLGIYYSPVARYNRYVRDEINNLSLEFNPTGCTMINLLIYKIEKNETWLLFVSKSVKEKRQHDRVEVTRQLLLTFPSSNPCRRDEHQIQVAERALKTITNENEILSSLRSRLKRFLFVDASSIYPLYLTNEQADILTEKFSPNDEVTSLHWFRLSTVLSQLPEWNNYLTREAIGKELAQVRHDDLSGIRLSEENEAGTLWSVTAFCLMCIRNHVGFEEFLKL